MKCFYVICCYMYYVCTLTDRLSKVKTYLVTKLFPCIYLRQSINIRNTLLCCKMHLPCKMNKQTPTIQANTCTLFCYNICITTLNVIFENMLKSTVQYLQQRSHRNNVLLTFSLCHCSSYIHTIVSYGQLLLHVCGHAVYFQVC